MSDIDKLLNNAIINNSLCLYNCNSHTIEGAAVKRITLIILTIVVILSGMTTRTALAQRTKYSPSSQEVQEGATDASQSQGTQDQSPILLREVFDIDERFRSSDLRGGSVEALFRSEPQWPRWDEIYFDRATYVTRLEEALKKDGWPVGNKTWQVNVEFGEEEKLKMGGNIYFRLNFPLSSVRENNGVDPLITVHDGPDGVIIEIVGGIYRPAREGDIGRPMFLSLIMVIGGCLLVLLIFVIINVITEGVSPNSWRIIFVLFAGAAILLLAFNFLG